MGIVYCWFLCSEINWKVNQIRNVVHKVNFNGEMGRWKKRRDYTKRINTFYLTEMTALADDYFYFK